MIDEAACKKIGRPFYREDEDPQKVKYYPLRNILFYTQIPYMKEQVMSREFEFLIADVGIHFVLSSYVKEVIGKGFTHPMYLSPLVAINEVYDPSPLFLN